MEVFSTIVNVFQRLATFAESSILDVWYDTEYFFGVLDDICRSCLRVCVFTSIHHEGFICLE